MENGFQQRNANENGFLPLVFDRYGPNFYGMYRSGYGGMNSLSPYSSFGTYRPYGGGMYNNWGGPTGGFGFGGAPFDRGNPQGGNQGDLLNGALIHPWQALMHTVSGYSEHAWKLLIIVETVNASLSTLISLIVAVNRTASRHHGAARAVCFSHRRKHTGCSLFCFGSTAAI